MNEQTSTKALVVSTALKQNSKTLTAATAASERLATCGLDVDIVDLATSTLPQCDGGVCYQAPGVIEMTKRVADATLIVLCFPIYNYQANSATKNFIEVTNAGWKDKVVSLIANAGGERSYLAPLSIANALMVDHRCLIVPHFLYLPPAAYDESGQLALQGDHRTLLADQLDAACRLSQFACSAPA